MASTPPQQPGPDVSGAPGISKLARELVDVDAKFRDLSERRREVRARLAAALFDLGVRTERTVTIADGVRVRVGVAGKRDAGADAADKPARVTQAALARAAESAGMSEDVLRSVRDVVAAAAGERRERRAAEPRSIPSRDLATVAIKR